MRWGLLLLWLVIAASLVTSAFLGWTALGTWFADRLLPGLTLAALISWLLPRALERYKGRRDHLYKTVDLLREQTRAYQKLATDSWRQVQTRKTLQAIEADLDFIVSEMIALMKLATDVGMENLYGPGSAGAKTVAKLSAAALGEAPAVGQRLADASRVTQINEAAVSLITLLLQERWAALNRR